MPVLCQVYASMLLVVLHSHLCHFLFLVAMHRFTSQTPNAPSDPQECSCDGRIVHELQGSSQLDSFRCSLLNNDQFKIVLRMDYLNHVMCPYGEYQIAGGNTCRSCYMWLRGLISREPLKEASLAVRKGLPVHRHGRTGQKIITEKKLDAIFFVLSECEVWGERMPDGYSRAGTLFVPFYDNPYDFWLAYKACCGPRAYDCRGGLQILSARAFCDLFYGRGTGHHFLKHIQFRRPAAFKKCSTCEKYGTQLRDLREKGMRPGCMEVDRVLQERKEHLDLVRSDRLFFLTARMALADLAMQLPGHILRTESRRVPPAHLALARRLLHADKSADIMHPSRFQQTDLITKLPQYGGLLFGLLDFTALRGWALMHPGDGIARMVRDDDAARLRKKAEKKAAAPKAQSKPKRGYYSSDALSRASSRAPSSTNSNPDPATHPTERAVAGGAKMKESVSWKGAIVFSTFLLSWLQNLWELGGSVEPHLYLQIDGGERTFTLLLLCAYLITIGKFEMVTIASHFPGHTHEVIDTLFSELRRAIAAAASGSLTWTEIVDIAKRIYHGEATSAKHGPVLYKEVQTMYDLDSFFKSLRNPGLRGLWNLRELDQHQKPHAFILQYRLEDGQRVVYLQSYVCASNLSEETLLTDWVPIFAPGAKLPSPSDVLTVDINQPFERKRTGLVSILESSPEGSLGLTARQVESYKLLRPPKLVTPPLPFGVTALPPHAGTGLAPSNPTQLSKKRAQLSTAVEEAEEEEEEKSSDLDNCVEDLMELRGSGTLLVKMSDGTMSTIVRDQVPDHLEGRYVQLVKERQDARIATARDTIYETWGGANLNREVDAVSCQHCGKICKGARGLASHLRGNQQCKQKEMEHNK
jgi:hypothetical protein